MDDARRPRLGVALVLAAATLWGTTGTAQSFASGALTPAWFGALRLAIAGLFFTVLAATAGTAPSQRAPAARRSDWPLLVLAGICMAIYNLAFFAGIRLAGVGLGTAVALGSGPLWAGLFEAAFARRLPSAAWAVGSALAVAGGACMSLANAAAQPGTGAVPWQGLALCAVAGAAYAGYALTNRHLAPHMSPSHFTRVAFGVAAVVALAGAAADGLPDLHARDVAPLVYVGVCTSGVAYLLLGRALRHIGAGTAVTLSLLEPVVAFVLALTWLGEPGGALAFTGLALVVAGVLAVARGAVATAPPAEAKRSRDQSSPA